MIWALLIAVCFAVIAIGMLEDLDGAIRDAELDELWDDEVRT